jgi:hypothetical protein
MRQRLDLAEAMLRERAQLSDMDKIGQKVMDEFEIVLRCRHRMSDFFMRQRRVHRQTGRRSDEGGAPG